jgi:nucleoside-diphosphate-sugar epimerase
MATAALPHLFCFGLGFSARALASRLIREGWIVSGTCRTPSAREELLAAGITAYLLDRGRPLDAAASTLAGVTDIVSSVPPDAAGDSVLDQHAQDIAACEGLRWVGYLSTTGVYGDTGGAVVAEDAALRPTSGRSRNRVAAERAWLDLHRTKGVPVHIFRLAGIYGPGRSAIDQVRAGQARRIDQPGHLFSRIHVSDVANVLRASMARPDPGRIYNVCDDMPASPADVTAFACTLLGVEPPPLVPLDDVRAEMSAMALSFWRDNRRVDNGRIKREIGVVLNYPDYRSGLQAIVAAEAPDAGPATSRRQA